MEPEEREYRAGQGDFAIESQFRALKSDWLAFPVYWLGLIPFVWLISAGLSEANGFGLASPAFMIMSATVLLYGSRGMVE